MFSDTIGKVIYHLDTPVAGPGSFPQFLVSKLAREHVTVCLGGQGGDEVFGGYARYLVAYLEQCIRAAIDGTYQNGNFVVTLESIIPRLGMLREYRPMLQMMWKEGLFGPLDERYFRLINRSNEMSGEIRFEELPMGGVFERFKDEFNRENVGAHAYFDKMTHFDLKFLLPALLQVEDRMSMAHGLESRVPFLDHPIIEFAATIPANVKYREGESKHILKEAYREILPGELMNRRDKMGFPVPLKEWFAGDLKDFLVDTFTSAAAMERPYIHRDKLAASIGSSAQFSRKAWGLLSLELWHQQYHDRSAAFATMLDKAPLDESAKVLHYPARHKAAN
jgi:asparagine synthase (glutamine-hydrolysing)